MTTRLCLHPSLSFLERDGVWVFYLDFGFTFFENEAAELIDRLMASLEAEQDPTGLPEDFLDFLTSKGFIREEEQ